MPAVGPKPTGRAGSSTIVQAPFGTQVTKPTQVARALTAQRRVFFTADDLKDPAKLHQVIYQQGQAAQTALHAVATNPLAVGVLLQGVPFTAGQTQYLNHGLGRPYTGWFVARTQATGGAAAYGTLYTQSSDAASLSLPVAATFVQYPLDHAGPSAGTTLTTGASGKCVVTAAGIYVISFTATVACSAAVTIKGGVFINGSLANDMTYQDAAASAGAAAWFPVSVASIRSLNAGDTIDARVSEQSLTAMTLTVDSCNLSVQALGGADMPNEAALPSGVTSDKQIGITCPLAGTYNIWVY